MDLAFNNSLTQLANKWKTLLSALGDPSKWVGLKMHSLDETGNFVCVCGKINTKTVGYVTYKNEQKFVFGCCCVSYYNPSYEKDRWFKNLVAVLGDHRDWRIRYTVIEELDVHDEPYKKFCICRHSIEENCYIMENKTKKIYVLGNCCIRLFKNVGKINTSKCDRCGRKHNKLGDAHVCKKLLLSRIQKLKIDCDRYNINTSNDQIVLLGGNINFSRENPTN